MSELQVGLPDERAEEVPGVKVARTYLRYYPHRELAAHVLGFVTEISAQLAGLRTQGYRGGDTIGQSGIEAKYDKYLRGAPGLAQLRVDSLGRPIEPRIPKVPPHPGNAVRLTIDLKLQGGGGASGAIRDRTCAQLRVHRLLVLERRRDRGDRSARRRDPGARLVSDLSAVAVRRPCTTRALDAAGLTRERRSR